LNLISQRLDTIYQIKPKHATIFFLHIFAELNTPQESHCLSVPPSGGSRLQSRELARAPSHHARACVRPCLRVRRKGAPMPWCIAAGALAPLWLLFFDACTHAAPAPSRASVLRGRTVGAQLQLQLQARAQATAMADASTEVNSCPSAATGYSMGQVVWLQVAGAGYRQPAGQQR
jgi:hypothetical protein